MATATRWATLVNWAVKQLAEASGDLWPVPKSFLAFVDSVAVDSKRFLCLQYRSYSLERHTAHTARHRRLLTAYTVTYFIARETNKRKLWGNVLSFLIIFSLPKGQDGCHLSSHLSEQLCLLFKPPSFQFPPYLTQNDPWYMTLLKCMKVSIINIKC